MQGCPSRSELCKRRTVVAKFAQSHSFISQDDAVIRSLLHLDHRPDEPSTSQEIDADKNLKSRSFRLTVTSFAEQLNALSPPFGIEPYNTKPFRTCDNHMADIEDTISIESTELNPPIWSSLFLKQQQLYLIFTGSSSNQEFADYSSASSRACARIWK